MTGKRARTFNIVAIVSCAVAVGVAAGFLVMGGDKTPLPDRETQQAVQEGCAKPVYVKIGEQVFGIQRQNIYSISYNNEQINAYCNTSFDAPVNADKLSFSAKIELSPNSKPHRIQYFIYLSDENKIMKKINEDIKLQNKTLSDLPKEGNFRKYVNNTKTTYYIFDVTTSSDHNRSPFVLYSCDKNVGVFSCSTAYLWRRNIVVVTRPNDQDENIPRSGSIDAWTAAFPIYLQTLRSALAKAPGGRP